MNIRSFLKQCMMQFFVITSCVTFATAVIGPYLMPNLQMGYHMFYSPPLIGLICTLPSFILYSKKELDLKHTIIRRMVHLLAIEILLCIPNWLSGNLKTVPALLVFIVTVLAVYLIVNLVGWFFESRDAKAINEGLKRLQNRK